MTYILEGFIEKIKAPVVSAFDKKEVEYEDGMTVCKEKFERYWLVDTIIVRDGKIILSMKENTRTNSVEWIGEEGIDRSFF